MWILLFKIKIILLFSALAEGSNTYDCMRTLFSIPLNFIFRQETYNDSIFSQRVHCQYLRPDKRVRTRILVYSAAVVAVPAAK